MNRAKRYIAIAHTYHLVIKYSAKPTYFIGAFPFLGFGGVILQFMSKSMTRFFDGVSNAIVKSHDNNIRTGVNIKMA